MAKLFEDSIGNFEYALTLVLAVCLLWSLLISLGKLPAKLGFASHKKHDGFAVKHSAPHTLMHGLWK